MTIHVLFLFSYGISVEMVRRSTPQQKIDDAAFPIRVKVFAPNRGYGGFGNLLNDMIYWLQDNLPGGDFAQYYGRSLGVRATTGFYLRSLEDAHRFLDAFPLSNWLMIRHRPAILAPSFRSAGSLFHSPDRNLAEKARRYLGASS
ncbi:hypothetical protein ACFSLT_03805 [Novosphingobium resinovorum]